MKLYLRSLLTMVILASGFGSASLSRAATYSVSGDFASATTAPTQSSPGGITNPNGVWSYGYLSSLGGSFTLYDVYAPNTSNGVRLDVIQPSNTQFGSTLSNESGQDWIEGAQHIASGWSGFNPGYGSAASILGDFRFTAPIAGTYSASLSFESGNTSSNTEATIYTNGILLYSQAICGGSVQSCAGLHSYNGSITLTAGQVLDIAVRDNGNGGFFDLTALEGTITGPAAAVPEPGTCTMLLAGLGLVAIGKRRIRGADCARAHLT